MNYKITKFYDKKFKVFEDGSAIRCAFYDKVGRFRAEKKTKPCDKDGYSMIGGILNGKSRPILMHRLVAKAYFDNYSDDLVVDHINRNRTDNRVSNLRVCTQAENVKYYLNEQGGRGKIGNRGTSSIYRGVSWNTKKKQWIVHFRNLQGKRVYGGAFKRERDAAIRYNTLACDILDEWFVPNEIVDSVIL